MLSGENPELGELPLRFHLGLCEVPPHGFRHVLDLGRSGTQLDGIVAMCFGRALSDHLTAVDLEDGHGHMVSVVLEDAGHP